MKALIETCSDDCTYSYDNVFFVMQDEMIIDDKFQDKLKEMFPSITYDDILLLIVERDQVKVYNDNGDSFIISIIDIEYFG